MSMVEISSVIPGVIGILHAKHEFPENEIEILSFFF